MTGDRPAESVTITHAGKRYRITRCAGLSPDTVVERFPALGLIGSDRRFIAGAYFAKSVTWWAAVNPSGRPGGALANVERLSSRRAAITWLLATALEAQQRAEGTH